MKSIYSYALAVEELLAPLTPEQREQVILLVYQPVPDAPRAEKVVAEKRDARSEPMSREQRRRQILTALLESSYRTMKTGDLARSCGLTQQALSKYLLGLAKAGLIMRTHGKITLSDVGAYEVQR